MIPVIDLFAGAGGLGEGFSAFRDARGRRIFRIALSIEKDRHARETLKLRSFFHQFVRPPDAYYDFLKRKIGLAELYQRYPKEAERADQEAWQAELGKHPASEIDDRIARALDGRDDWVLLGAPPCQSYSLAGRAGMVRKREKYEKDPRHFLYREFLRVLAVHRPPVFIMENVKGILSAKVGGSSIINRILADLKRPCKIQRNKTTYRLYPLADYSNRADSYEDPAKFIIRCELHGIPQMRHRFIVLGVRSDLSAVPRKLPVLPETVNMWKAIADLPPLRSRLSGGHDSPHEWAKALRTILNRKIISNIVDPEVRCLLIKLAHKIQDDLSTGGEFVESSRKPSWQRDWFFDPRIGGVCNHSARCHMASDLLRYFFAAVFAEVHGRSPLLTDFPVELLPEHENIDKKVFLDRFRVQLKNRPSTTIISHIKRDGHYYIHPDPLQCRSITVREAARLQTFPDNYAFLGPRTSQYEQIGNAVPPLLAKQIAGIVSKLMPCREPRP
jgi:DNA (cytosine-5)-methyltransferase 1